MTVGELDSLDWPLAPESSNEAAGKLTPVIGDFKPRRVLTSIGFLNRDVPTSNDFVISQEVRIRTISSNQRSADYPKTKDCQSNSDKHLIAPSNRISLRGVVRAISHCKRNAHEDNNRLSTGGQLRAESVFGSDNDILRALLT
jgi:hypothetical protein